MKLHRNNDRFCESKAPTDADLRAQLRAEQAEDESEAEREKWNEAVEATDQQRQRLRDEYDAMEEAEEIRFSGYDPISEVTADHWAADVRKEMLKFYQKEFDKRKGWRDSLPE